jgi:hypothetical protein
VAGWKEPTPDGRAEEHKNEERSKGKAVAGETNHSKLTEHATVPTPNIEDLNLLAATAGTFGCCGI